MRRKYKTYTIIDKVISDGENVELRILRAFISKLLSKLIENVFNKTSSKLTLRNVGQRLSMINEKINYIRDI